MGGKCVKCGSNDKLYLLYTKDVRDSTNWKKNYNSKIKDALEHPERFELICRYCYGTSDSDVRILVKNRYPEPKPKRIFPKKYAVMNNKEFYKNKNLKYKGKVIYFDKAIRTGICSYCKRSKAKGEITHTQLHHYKYDDNDPLAYTDEVCVSCHYNIDWNNKKKIDSFFKKK